MPKTISQLTTSTKKTSQMAEQEVLETEARSRGCDSEAQGSGKNGQNMKNCKKLQKTEWITMDKQRRKLTGTPAGHQRGNGGAGRAAAAAGAGGHGSQTRHYTGGNSRARSFARHVTHETELGTRNQISRFVDSSLPTSDRNRYRAGREQIGLVDADSIHIPQWKLFGCLTSTWKTITRMITDAASIPQITWSEHTPHVRTESAKCEEQTKPTKCTQRSQI